MKFKDAARRSLQMMVVKVVKSLEPGVHSEFPQAKGKSLAKFFQRL